MAAKRSLEALTYREKIRDTSQLTRELVEHLQLSLEPRLQRVKDAIRVRGTPGEDHLPDIAIRNLAGTVLESGQFASGIGERLERYCHAIVEESASIVESR